MNGAGSRPLVGVVSVALAVGVIAGVEHWRMRPLDAACEDSDDCRSEHCVGTTTRDGLIPVMVKGSGRCVSACVRDTDCSPGKTCTTVAESLGPIATSATSGGVCLER
jgi:hypothetical protein